MSEQTRAAPTLRRATLVVLAVLTAAGPFGTDLYLPGLPAAAADLHTSTSGAQLSVTAFLLGLAVGQLVAGPIGDRFGRRRPILLGSASYAVVSLACALAPTIGVLVPLRLVQGLLGAVGLVLARAWVRDVSTGVAAARTFALLTVVGGVVPVVAPVIGAQILRFGSWRLTFVALAVLGAVTVPLVLAFVPESLPPERRGLAHAAGGTIAVMRSLFGDVTFVASALAITLIGGCLFAYITGSPFVLQDVYGLSQQQFAAVFALNAAGIITMSLTSRRLGPRVGLGRLVLVGLGVASVGAVGMLVTELADLGVGAFLAGLFLVVAPVGLVLPNAMALGLARHGDHAGTAAGVLGVCQFSLAIVAAPLTSIGGPTSGLPLAVLVCVLLAVALATVPWLLHRGGRFVGAPVDATPSIG